MDKTVEVQVILATDCGSTTSKARLFKKIGNEFRFVAAGESPTTVEAPYENVTLGVINAVREIEELIGEKLLRNGRIIQPRVSEHEGVDLYITTSSAGGGLQMQVIGCMRNMTAESAERAALGAGAIVLDVIAIDDGRKAWEKIERIRFLRPDMILFSGGTDGGTIRHIVELAELLRSADPKHRLGIGYTVPIVYAGNKDARGNVKNIIGNKFAVKMVDNIRPTLERENPGPARTAVHELFMEHVMSHAPGYDQLMTWTPLPIMPTPAGEGIMFRIFAESHHVNLIGVGLGGATTNIYSIYDGLFVRSVSANLGMSYSICNVLKETGIKNIMRWLPFEIEENVVSDMLYNKMIRPTTIPETLKELIIEHAVSRESIRLAFKHHKELAQPLRGGRDDTGLESILHDDIRRYETYIDMMNVDYIGGTGGLLSHAPKRSQSALILIDSFQPEGVTELFQDSVFMIPHLGVLSTIKHNIALEIFEKDCLVRLGTCISPVGQGKYGDKIGDFVLELPNGQVIKEDITFGSIKRIPLDEGKVAKLEVNVSRRFRLKAGVELSRGLSIQVEGGVVGVIIDARGRPLKLPENDDERRSRLIEWLTAMKAHPKEKLKS